MDGADEEEEEHQRLHFGSLSNTTSSLGGLCSTEYTPVLLLITVFVKIVGRYLFH